MGARTRNNNNKESQINLEKATSLSLTQRTDSSAAHATSCAVPSAHCRQVQSLSCEYATSMPQCHILPICQAYIVLSNFPTGGSPPWPLSHPKASWLNRSTTPNDIIGVHILNFYCYYLHTINWTILPYLNVMSDVCTTRKQQHGKFSCRLVQSSQLANWTVQKRTTSNTMAMYNLVARLQQCAISSWIHCYIFANFS